MHGPPPHPPGGSSALRQQGLRGASWLAVRDVAGLVVRFGGVLLLTRLLGVADYGRYAGAVVAVTALSLLAQLGAEAWLVRREEGVDDVAVGTVTALLLLTGSGSVLLAASVAWGLRDVLGERALVVFLLVLLSLPVNILWAPAQAVLERRLRFRELGTLELAGDVVLYTTTILGVLTLPPLVGAGLGYLAWQSFLLVGAYRLSGLRPGLAWDGALAREVVRFGVPWGGATLLQSATLLVNPLVVGASLGAAAVGQVALALRLMEALGFISRSAQRVGLALLSRVRDDRQRLARALDDGCVLQVLALGPVLLVLVAVAPSALPRVFGPEYGPAGLVLPFVAVAALGNAAFALQTALLAVEGQQQLVVRAYALRLVLVLTTAAALVPRHGLVGYGLAELVGTTAWLVTDRGVRQRLPRSAGALLGLVALGPPLLLPLVPERLAALLLVPAAVVLLVPPLRATLSQPVRDLIDLLRTRR